MTEYTTRDLIERMTALGAQLMPLKPGIKKPSGTGWTVAAALTVDQADQHVADGGNLGVNLGNSKMIAFDCEDLLASQAVAGAGFAPTVIPAKAQYEGILKPGLEDPDSGKQNRKVDGSHVWLLLPDGIDPTALTSERSMQLRLPNGGTMDVLAGPRYVVAPPSALELAYGEKYLPSAAGSLDVSSGGPLPGLATAPMWLFDLSVPCPPELAPLHGCLIPMVRERVEQNARSIELSNQIDEIPWSAWIAGDHRITLTGEVDGCGCDIGHYLGASHSKSVTLHDGCEQGNGAHIWSGTMLAELGLPGEHVSRLDLAVGLQGESRHVVAAGHGITLGEERQELGIVSPGAYERTAAHFEELGDADRAAMYREAAKVMRSVAPTPEQRGETFLDGPVTGWVPTTPIQRPVQPAERMATVYPFPVVHPTFTPTPAPADTEAAPTGAAPSIGNLGVAAPAGPAPAIGALGGPVAPTAGGNALQVDPAQTQPNPKPKRKSNWRDEVDPLEAELFTMTPGLRTVAAAADALGSGRQGVLAVTLTRVATKTGPHVRLLTAAGMRGTARQGGSLNMYTALVGKPNAGKTDAMDAGTHLVPMSDDWLIPEGTGEGIVKTFGFMRREKHGKGEDAFYTYTFTKLADQILLAADEVDSVFAEMVRQGSKFASMWRSMWMGAMVGTTTGDIERRTRLLPHTYRLGVLLGCQPDATIPLWEEGSRGTPQRILWAPCTRRRPNGKPVPEPLKLAYQEEPAPTTPGIPAGYRPPTDGEVPDFSTPGGYVNAEPEPQWIEWPSEARAFIEAELAELEEDDDPYGEGDDDEEDEILKLLGHSTFMRLKIMALLGIMDGLEQPENVHWRAAGIVMQLREMCMRRTKARATRAGKVVAENKGVDQGIQRSTARRAEEAETAKFDRDLTAKIYAILGRLQDTSTKATSAAITRLANRNQKEHVPDRLEKLLEKGYLGRDVENVYFAVRLPPD
ncbi:bifunctional DNA primase/polymerase [Mycobacteroides abscessus]|uniref:bifunctional DNA primase/polymerase n=1 Tax=Mycobacteroides abscessus TaxID=36809 RepID=UPI00092756BA|nr:bifunctional DNA primase/polymerase [Mycobacteroides abscessus]MBN7296624.1 bifunctional DNA primase/polymerase [Mycobacteroides abscessus subsp. abscessus]SHR98107.1 Bifunctional DNA primase/polymerase, N-terminal [Mycobacteroides abscessus subsp. abscessus]